VTAIDRKEPITHDSSPSTLAALFSCQPTTTAARESAQGDRPLVQRRRGAIRNIAATAATPITVGASGEEGCLGGECLLRGSSRPASPPPFSSPDDALRHKNVPTNVGSAATVAVLPSLTARPICDARGSRSVFTDVGNRQNTLVLYLSHAMPVPAGAHRVSASLVAALKSRQGRYSCMHGTRCEKGIVVSVASCQEQTTNVGLARAAPSTRISAHAPASLNVLHD